MNEKCCAYHEGRGGYSGQIEAISAKAVMFGTGGYGRAFRVTTNAFASTGDGVVMAKHAGCWFTSTKFRVRARPRDVSGTRLEFLDRLRQQLWFCWNEEVERRQRQRADQLQLHHRRHHQARDHAGRYRRRRAPGGYALSGPSTWQTIRPSSGRPGQPAVDRGAERPDRRRPAHRNPDRRPHPRRRH